MISATFGSELETKLNTWGANGWEVISIAGMNGTVTLTGNKIFVVLKRRSLRHEAVAATAADYLETLRNHYGPALFDQLENRHGRELMERAARALVWVGQQPNNPLGVLDHACELMAESNYERDGWAIRQAWSDTEGQPVPE